MGLEGRDISDAEIMDATQIIGGVNDTIQFKLRLPSGRELESEFFKTDKRKEAMLAWVDVVRQQRVDDAEEVRAKARRVAQEQKLAAPALVGPDGDVLTASPQPLDQSPPFAGSSPGYSTPAGPSSGSPMTALMMPQPLTSPLEYANQALQTIRGQRANIQAQMMQLMAQEAALAAQEGQWTQILNMSGAITNASYSGAVNSASSTQGQSVPKRPRGRPRKRPAGGSILGTEAGSGTNS